ncbi:hypothetical protein B0H14DRAFT_784296 [Mycena olivaceomarginata]|nr:hypothetical protein B0H14DRAFT_784296 [Mycena olivaceomarginata]
MLFPNAFGETTFSFPFWFILFGLYENCWSQVPACVQLPEAIQVSVEQEDSRSECKFCDDIGSSVLEDLDGSSEGLTRDSCPTYGMVLRSILDHSVDGMHLFLHSADQYGSQRLLSAATRWHEGTGVTLERSHMRDVHHRERRRDLSLRVPHSLIVWRRHGCKFPTFVRKVTLGREAEEMATSRLTMRRNWKQDKTRFSFGGGR